MKNFLRQTKYEERQAHYEESQAYSLKLMNKAVFLNDIKSPNLASVGIFRSLSRPRTPVIDNSMLLSPREEPKEVTKTSTGSPKKLKRKTPAKVQKGNKLKDQNEPEKLQIRRRSCCCKWCGGISALEMKHQDIITELEKYGRGNSPDDRSPNRLQQLVDKRGGITSLLELGGRSGTMGDLNRKDNRAKASNDDLLKKKNQRFSSINLFSFKSKPSIVFGEEQRLELKEKLGLLKASDSSPTQKSKKESGGRTDANRDIIEDDLMLEEKDDDNSRKNGLQKSKTFNFKLSRQETLSPLKMQQFNNFSPTINGTLDLDSLKTTSSIGSPISKHRRTNSNIKTTGGNATPGLKEANLASTNLLQKVMTNCMKSMPDSPVKFSNTLTPISVSSLKKGSLKSKIKRPKLLDKEFYSELKSSQLSNRQYTAKGTELPVLTNFLENLDANKTPIEKSSAGPYTQLSYKLKSKESSPKAMRRTVKSVLKAANIRVASIYGNDKSLQEIRKKSSSLVRYPNTLFNQALSDSKTTTNSPRKLDAEKPGSKQSSKAVEDEDKVLLETEPNKTRQRKNVRVKLRKEVSPFAILDSSEFRKGSFTTNPTPLHFSSQSNFTKEKRR